jgi:hypothetical protein
MATVRAKLRCTSVTNHADMTARTFEFTAQYDTSIPEDRRFQQYSPSATFKTLVDNPAIDWQPGKSYYVDFTPVEEMPANEANG